MRRAAKVDRNQSAIIRALRDAGASVQPLYMVGQGCPDLLIGKNGKNFVMEIKNPEQTKRDQRLTEDEFNWHSSWRGQVQIVTSVEEALHVLRSSDLG